MLSVPLLPFLQPHMWDGDSWSWAGWLAMALMMALFWGGVLVLAIWALRGGARHHHHDSPDPRPDSALGIARERFARGEINDEEFERIKRGLS